MKLDVLKEKLREFADPKYAITLRRFYKGRENFIGVRVPQIRKLVTELSFEDCAFLICSEIHEERLLAVLILVEMYQKYPEEVFQLYLDHSHFLDEWDLIDLSAEKIVGPSADLKKRIELAKSSGWWDRRIAMVSTFYLIRKNQFDQTFKLAELLFDDEHDLIHKAVGWMLREVYKRDPLVGEEFILKHAKKMVRVTLRTAIERIPEKKRKEILTNSLL